jgi:hypothetical protein
MAGRIGWRMWRDPVLGDLWVIELLADRIVGYTGPVLEAFDLNLEHFERDPGFLRRTAERWRHDPGP